MLAVTIHDLHERGFLAFDLIDILRLAESETRASIWECRGVECVGKLADELHSVPDAAGRISGSELLRLAEGVHQVIDGTFKAYRGEEISEWLEIQAVDSTMYVVVTGDNELVGRIREWFRDVRESPGDDARG